MEERLIARSEKVIIHARCFRPTIKNCLKPRFRLIEGRDFKIKREKQSMVVAETLHETVIYAVPIPDQ